MYPRFSFVIALTEINKANDFRVPRDSQVKYNFNCEIKMGVHMFIKEHRGIENAQF